MWIYKQTERNPNFFTVGHYDPSGKFIPESDWLDYRGASNRVNFLNGGSVTKIYKGEPLPPGDLMEPD